MKSEILNSIQEVAKDRKINPQENSYTNYLFDKGIDKILKKVGEEATETIIASKSADKKETIYETADLLYHITVMLTDMGIEWDEVFDELEAREIKSGNLKKKNHPEEISEY